MSDEAVHDPVAEARAWFERLGQPRITTTEVQAFARWRDDPQNDAAYSALESRYLDASRFVVRPEVERYRVIDIWTGETAVVAMTRQDGLSEKDATHVAKALNARSAKGDGGLPQ